MVGVQAAFVKEAHSLTADFLGRMSKDKGLSVAKKDTYRDLVTPLMEFVS